MNEEMIAQLQKDVAQLTEVMREKAVKNYDTEVKELSEKLSEVQKELSERKVQFAVQTQSKSDLTKKEVATRLDELYIAKALCVNVDTGVFDREKFDKVKSMSVYDEAIKAAATFDAVFADTTTGTNTGAEFIPKGFSAQLQNEIWLALEVAGLFGRMQMPASDWTLPFNPSRLIARAGAEGASVTKDQAATSKIQFTAKKIMSIVEMTDEFEQDSIVPALNFIRQQLIDGFALAQETMCLNGDTGTSIYSVAKAGEDARKLVKGIRADAMGTSCKVDAASGGMSETNLRAARALMGKYGKSPKDLSIIVSMADYNKMLTFTAYQSLYSFGPDAVIRNGELGKFDGIPILVTELLPKPGDTTDTGDSLAGLNASGVFDGTTHTKATAVITNSKGYSWGDRKEFSLELFRNVYSQTTNLIGSQRLDFEKIASASATTTSVLYNY